MSPSPALVQTISPRSNSILQSPAHGVTGPAPTQLPRWLATTPLSKTIDATATLAARPKWSLMMKQDQN